MIWESSKAGSSIWILHRIHISFAIDQCSRYFFPMRGILKDFGIFAKHRLNVEQSFLFQKLRINSFARIADDSFTFMTKHHHESWDFALSIDFDTDILQSLLKDLGTATEKSVRKQLALGNSIKLGEFIELNVRANLDKRILENREESFIPFKAISIKVWAG